MALNFPHQPWTVVIHGVRSGRVHHNVAAFDDNGVPWVPRYVPGVGARLIPATELGELMELYPAH